MTFMPRPQHVDRPLLACLCLFLALLQILDLHSSLRAANAGRAETNPVILWAMPFVGFAPAVIVCKVTALAIIGAYHRVMSRANRKLQPVIVLAPVCAAYTVIVLNNYS